MTYADGRFLLVREELDEEKGTGTRTRRTVARVLDADRPPDLLRIVRPAEGREETGFIDTALSPDGRVYLWVGPRDPPKNLRVEVREVNSGQLIRQVSARAATPSKGELSVALDPQGGELWVQLPSQGIQHYELSGADCSPEPLLESVPIVSHDHRWLAFLSQFGPNSINRELILRRRIEARNWIKFPNDDVSGPRVPASAPTAVSSPGVVRKVRSPWPICMSWSSSYRRSRKHFSLHSGVCFRTFLKIVRARPRKVCLPEWVG